MKFCFFNSALYYIYLATLSSHFNIASINNIEATHTATNTVQVMEIEIFSYIIAPKISEKFPTAVAVNHPPCINPCICGGATFETKDNPKGDINNSATVSIK